MNEIKVKDLWSEDVLQPETPRIVGTVSFHGQTLLVVQPEDFAGGEYVYAKPLSDLAGLDWRATEELLMEEEHVSAYGSVVYRHPILIAQRGPRRHCVAGIYLLLERARAFLTDYCAYYLKEKGDIEAHEALLDLQVDWARALYEYEVGSRNEATQPTIPVPTQSRERWPEPPEMA